MINVLLELSNVLQKQILELEKDFSEVIISDNILYWHFKCVTKPAPHDK
jgi:hypothetical protein